MKKETGLRLQPRFAGRGEEVKTVNESVIRTEEQIISLFPDRETFICQGWVLKKMERQLLVYPLYYKFSQGNILDNIRKCEDISRQNRIDCAFRIVEHTNYYLSSVLMDSGYGVKEYGVVGEWSLTGDAGRLCAERNSRHLKSVAAGEDAEYVMTETDKVVGIKRQGLLFLSDGNLPGADLEDVLRFSVENGIIRMLADIPGKEELPEQYGWAGFRRAYLYRCYQKKEN